MGEGIAFPIERSHSTSQWCIMAEFQTFNGCYSKNEEWMLLKICEALVKNACSTNVTKSFASRLFNPVFGIYAIIQQ